MGIWNAVLEDTIRHSFKACGIALSLDGTEDGLLNDRRAEVVNAEYQHRAQILFESDKDDDAIDFSVFSASEDE